MSWTSTHDKWIMNYKLTISCFFSMWHRWKSSNECEKSSLPSSHLRSQSTVGHPLVLPPASLPSRKYVDCENALQTWHLCDVVSICVSCLCWYFVCSLLYSSCLIVGFQHFKVNLLRTGPIPNSVCMIFSSFFRLFHNVF